MKPLLHVVSSNRLLIAAFSDHGEIVQVFHQARVALDGEHHPGPLTRSIGHIPPSEGRRLGGSFREHVHAYNAYLAPCREGMSPAQKSAVQRWRQALHSRFNLKAIHIRRAGEIPHGVNQSRREEQCGGILTRQDGQLLSPTRERESRTSRKKPTRSPIADERVGPG